MPRKQRCRCIGGYPDHWEFSPEEASDKEPVVMSLDEFETIRLLDYEGLTQEQCAERMGVARTTVTAIYESARRKMAEALVDGKRLLIRGGNYRLNDQGAENITEKGTDNKLLVRVRRYRHCILRYLDENWEPQEKRMDDDMSELIQHEYDHLDGILATMRAIDNKSFVMKK